MVEIKRIVCDDQQGETLWEGVLVPSKRGNYEGYIHSSVLVTYINFEYVNCDVKMTIKRKSDSDVTTSQLALINDSGLTEWFTDEEKNTIVCTKENVNNILAKTYQKQLEYNKHCIEKRLG